MSSNNWGLFFLKLSPLLIPLILIFYNHDREAKLPPDTKVIDIAVGDRKISDRYTILQVSNLMFQYNQGYWESELKTCPEPKAVATFEVDKKLPPLSLLFGSDWVCAHAKFNGRIQTTLWHPPAEIETKLRELLAINI